MTDVYLFRAVNVGGIAKLPMADLRALAAELGATDVRTYIASATSCQYALQFVEVGSMLVHMDCGGRRGLV